MSGLRAATAALALAGVAVAGYLTWVHYADLQPFCVGGGGACERVQTSEYAALFGIPVAVLLLFLFLMSAPYVWAGAALEAPAARHVRAASSPPRVA